MVTVLFMARPIAFRTISDDPFSCISKPKSTKQYYNSWRPNEVMFNSVISSCCRKPWSCELTNHCLSARPVIMQVPHDNNKTINRAKPSVSIQKCSTNTGVPSDLWNIKHPKTRYNPDMKYLKGITHEG
jgi:hypothetical protein